MIATKFLNPAYGTSLNQRFREERFRFFKTLLDRIPANGKLRILDVGGTETYWERMNFKAFDRFEITLLNLEAVPVRNPAFKSAKGDATNMKEYADGSYDVVYSNSVIEHLFTHQNQQRMAEEVRRVGKNYFIQTPNYYFPMEPHWLVPFFQFLPWEARVRLTRNFDLGNYKKSPDRAAAERRVNEVQLLTEKQMKALFPDGEVYREQLFGLVKSISMYRFPNA